MDRFTEGYLCAIENALMVDSTNTQSVEGALWGYGDVLELFVALKESSAPEYIKDIIKNILNQEGGE